MPTKLERILQKYDGHITGLQDLTGDDPPSKLFYILANCLSYLFDEDSVTARSIARRRRVNPIIKKLGARFLPCPQIFENRNFLRNPTATDTPPDPGITLPDEPVIWMPNHGFKDDPLATVLAAQRHAYILFGSLPQFFNTIDGVTAWLNGVVMMNRKVADSRRTAVAKSLRVLGLGTDFIVYPEGILNKSPNALTLPLWPGIYRLACESGAKIVPIVHYIRDADRRAKDNPIHTVVDDPIRIDDLGERAALEYLRDVLATWRYLMMEAYGQAERDDLLDGFSSATEAWEAHLRGRIGLMDFYDREIELCADYRPKDIVRPEQVWKAIAKIKHPTRANVLDMEYARRLIQDAAENDFQRRF